jgi:anaerobic magnesium-protoporphyrin IX monomethyl ester cyclase
MNVLLINPLWPGGRIGARRYQRAWPPLDLLNLASLLRERGHEPRLIDARAMRVEWSEISRAARAADLVVLQTTPLDRWQCPDLNWDALKVMAGWLPVKKLVLAGAHGTVAPELILETTEAWMLVRGEPEIPLADLADNGGNPSGINGMVWRGETGLVVEPAPDPIVLDDLPAPAYDLVDLGHYAYELMGPRMALLETSRGCLFHCIFCLKAMYGPGIRWKSLDRVLSEMICLRDVHGAETFYFIDLEFTCNRARTTRFCRMIIERGITVRWCCQTRVDAVDPDLLVLMKQAGCRLIHFGLETGSERVLRKTGKKVTIGQMQQAMDWCRETGVKTAGFFLFGLPGEGPVERRKTMRLAGRLHPTYASFHVAAPYHGTMLHDSHQGNQPFPVCLSPEHDIGVLGRAVRRAYLSFYFRPRYWLDRFLEIRWSNLYRRIVLLWKFMR